jgi:hypothetical protein
MSGADEPVLQIHDLGPLLVARSGVVRPLGGALAAALTLLLVRAGEPVLVRTGGGLTLAVPADRIDSRRFETLADQT